MRRDDGQRPAAPGRWPPAPDASPCDGCDEVADLRRRLAAQEARLDEIQRIAQLGSWELDLVTNHLTWSAEIFRIFELDPAEFGASYEAFLAAIHPDDRALVDEAYTASVTSRTPYAITHRLLFSDGREKVVHERGRTFYDDDGRPIRSVGTVQDVTTRVDAERRLAVSEARYRQLFETMRDAFAAVDMDGRFLEANQAFCQLLGREQDALRRLTLRDLMPPRWHALLSRIIRERLLVQGHSEVFETELTHVSGAVLPVELRILLARDPDGTPRAMWTVVRDLSSRRRAELALRESEARYRLIFENTSDLQTLVRLEPEGRQVIEAMNPRQLAALQRLRPDLCLEDFIGRERDVVLRERGLDDRTMPSVVTFAERAIETGAPVRFESVIPLDDLATVYFDTTIVPVRDDHGRLTHLLWSLRDITESRLADEALLASRARLALVFDHTSDMQVLLRVEPGPSYVTEALNRRFRQVIRAAVPHLDAGDLLGWERSEVLVGLGFPRESLESEMVHFARAVHTGTVQTYDLDLTVAGVAMHLAVSVVPVLGPGGACTHLLWSARDESERHRAEAAVRSTAERLAAQLAEKDVLLREVHHRVKNNLQVVISLLRLQEQRLGSLDAGEVLRDSRDRVAAMALIHEKLYASPSLASVDVASYVRELGDSLLSSHAIERGRVRLVVEGTSFTLDLNRAIPCGLIVNELLSNALKHAFPGGRQGTITVTLDAGEVPEIVVRDDGVGMPMMTLGELGRSQTLGLRFLPGLAAQLGATITRLDGPGTVYRLRLREGG